MKGKGFKVLWQVEPGKQWYSQWFDTELEARAYLVDKILDDENKWNARASEPAYFKWEIEQYRQIAVISKGWM